MSDYYYGADIDWTTVATQLIDTAGNVSSVAIRGQTERDVAKTLSTVPPPGGLTPAAPNIMKYVPYIAGGAALLLVLVFVMKR